MERVEVPKCEAGDLSMLILFSVKATDPTTDVSEIFAILYPYRSTLPKEGVSAVTNVLGSFRVKPVASESHLRVTERKLIDPEKSVVYVNNNAAIEVSVLCILPTNFLLSRSSIDG